MMMERAKTAPAPESTKTSSAKQQHEKPVPSAPATQDASAEERVQDLERRLNLLGGDDAPATAAPEKPTAAQTGKNNPLLKRIQAAQERARLAEQKEKEAKAAAASEMARAAERERIDKAQSALRSVAGRALEDKQKSILAQLEGKAPAPATAAGEQCAAVPIMKTLDRPPPSFDSMKFPPPKEMQQQLQQPHMRTRSGEMVGHGMNSRALSQPMQQQQAAPPSFDFVEKQMIAPPAAEAPPAPTAPTISPSAPPTEYLRGVMPVAPPFAPQATQQAPPPPSFAAFEQQQQAPPAADDNARSDPIAAEEDAVFDYDLDGNPLSPQQRQALLDEQRLLYESIMKEKAANDAAIARANADAFDLRSSSAAARAMPGGEDSLAGHARAMDSLGRDVMAPAAASAGTAASEGGEEGEGDEEGEAARRASRRMVKIGNNQMVALHGQDRTKKAIKEGTAILVQCINCQNWMQVTDTATLMFCPVCQVVSPVIQQNEVLTKEEAIQLTMDRKLAEKLQAEAYNQGEEGEAGAEEEDQGFLSNFFTGIGGAVASSADAAMDAVAAPETKGAAEAGGKQHQQPDSWWNKISSIVSYGVADESEERGDMGVTLPPGASASEYPARRGGGPAAVGGGTASRSSHAHAEEETRGLLSPVVVDGNEANLPSARVAESKPLFSCVMDSVSSAASAVFTGGEDVRGVDSSSLLVTNAGRGVGDGTGDYSKLPDRE